MAFSEITNGESGLSVRTKLNTLKDVEEAATADQTGAEIKALYEAEPNTNAYTDAAVAKLAGIESGATADQSGAEIKALYEAQLDTNAYTDASVVKLAGIESGATADQTDGEIETAYNNQVDVVSQAEAEAGTATTVRRWTAQRVAQAIAALGGGGAVTALNNQAENRLVSIGATTTELDGETNLTYTDSALYAYSDFTDASNYSRFALNTSLTTEIELAAESSGTGEANIDLVLTPAGTGRVILDGFAYFNESSNILELRDGATTENQIHLYGDYQSSGAVYRRLELGEQNSNIFIYRTRTNSGQYLHAFYVNTTASMFIRNDAVTPGSNFGQNLGQSNTAWDDAYLGNATFTRSASTVEIYDRLTGTNTQSLSVYNTHTDASNYERATISGTTGTSVEIAAESAGIGAANLDLVLTPAGSGNVQFGTHSAIGAETVTGFITVKDSGGTLRKLAVVS